MNVSTRLSSFLGSLRVSCALAPLVTSGCSQILDVCTRDLSWQLSPRERTLRVGETFTPTLTLFGCGGTERLSDTITWDTADDGVVSVDATTGRVTATAVGQAAVVAMAERYAVDDTVSVTVIAP